MFSTRQSRASISAGKQIPAYIGGNEARGLSMTGGEMAAGQYEHDQLSSIARDFGATSYAQPQQLRIVKSNMSESGAQSYPKGFVKPLGNYQHHHNYTVQKTNAAGLANFRVNQARHEVNSQSGMANDIDISNHVLGKPPQDKSLGRVYL